jgi:hypothetical protein
VTPYVHFKGWGPWGWASRAGPGGGGAWGLSRAPRSYPQNCWFKAQIAIFTRKLIENTYQKEAGGRGGARPSLVSHKREGGGGLTVWPLGGLEVNIGGQLQNDLTLMQERLHNWGKSMAHGAKQSGRLEHLHR